VAKSIWADIVSYLKVEVVSNWWLSAQKVRVTEIADITHHSSGIGMQIWV